MGADLEGPAADLDGVVPRDDAGLFVTENRVQIPGAERDERTRRVARLAAKCGVVLGHEGVGEALANHEIPNGRVCSPSSVFLQGHVVVLTQPAVCRSITLTGTLTASGSIR